MNFSLALVLLAGCAIPGIASGSCGSDAQSDPATGMRVHVDTLNDANENIRVCYQFGGGGRHAIDLARSGTTPNVRHAFDGFAAAGDLSAWFADSDAIFRGTSANATETWYVLTTGASSVRIDSFDHAPAFD